MNKKEEYTTWDAIKDAWTEDPKFRFTCIWMGLLTLASGAGLVLATKAAIDECKNSEVPEGVTITKF